MVKILIDLLLFIAIVVTSYISIGLILMSIIIVKAFIETIIEEIEEKKG